MKSIKYNKLPPEQKEVYDTLMLSELVYDSVIFKTNINKDDELYRNTLLGILKEQTKRFLTYSIWKNLDEKQTEHLKDYISQKSLIDPDLPTFEILIEFVSMYKSLSNKIYSELMGFFDEFIETVNKVNSTKI